MLNLFEDFSKVKKNLKLKKNFKNFNYFSNFQNLVSQLDLLSFFKKEIFQIFLMLSGKYSKEMGFFLVDVFLYYNKILKMYSQHATKI
jgi:hypothetical protein